MTAQRISSPSELFGPLLDHRCAWGRVCVNADIQQQIDPVTGRPIRLGAAVVDGPLCDADLQRVASAVKGLPRDYQRLGQGIGEKRSVDGARVAGSTELPIPINTYREMLQTRIVEIADRAAEVVEEELRMTGKARHRAVTPTGWDGRGFRAAGAASTGGPLMTVDHAAKLLLVSLEALLDAPTQPHLLWLPLPDSDEECDRHPTGQPRELVELSGIDIAWMIVRLSSDVYNELGRAQLRHRFIAPCPAWVSRERRYCRAQTVGRDDGSSVVDCETCGAAWSETEYWFIEGLVLDEIETREESDLMSYFLAESYWRLDTLRDRLAAGPPVDPDTVRQIIVEAAAEGGPQRAADKAAELVALITEHLTARAAVVLEMGTLDAEGKPIPHSRPEQRELAAKEYDRAKQDKVKQRRREAASR